VSQIVGRKYFRKIFRERLGTQNARGFFQRIAGARRVLRIDQGARAGVQIPGEEHVHQGDAKR
jgi:hypothetical protein